MMAAQIFIVRHGNTFAAGEEPRRVGAATDLPLVASGVAQAEALGHWFSLRSISVDRALVSPLLRTRQTAESILALGSGTRNVDVTDWLREVDHGPDENRTDADVIKRIGIAALAAWDRNGIAPPGWIVDAPARIAAWRAFFAAPGEGTTMLVTSNGAARYALLAHPELATHGRKNLKLRTGALAELTVDRDRNLSVMSWDVRPSDVQ